jgi:hypothetical protein
MNNEEEQFFTISVSLLTVYDLRYYDKSSGAGSTHLKITYSLKNNLF